MGQKDNVTRAGKIAYDFLFVIFVILLAMGVTSLYLVVKGGKFEYKAIAFFYISSLSVVLLRIVLFTD